MITVISNLDVSSLIGDIEMPKSVEDNKKIDIGMANNAGSYWTHGGCPSLGC